MDTRFNELGEREINKDLECSWAELELETLTLNMDNRRIKSNDEINQFQTNGMGLR